MNEVESRIDEVVGMKAAPELLAEWNHHNIMKYKNRFWGIPHVLGALDLTKKKARENPSVVSADTLDDVKIRIDEAVGWTADPERVEEWNHHNIIKYQNRFWGIPHILGEWDLKNKKSRKHASLVSADSLEEVKVQIDEAVGLTAVPELLEEWNHHNIIKYQNLFWGVPQALGVVDLAQEESRKNPSILSADSLEGVKNEIDERAGMASPPEFLEEFQKYNILKYNNRFLGIPIELGEIDPVKEEHRNHPSILSADTLEEVKSQIETVVGLISPPEFMEERSGYRLVKFRNRFYGIPHSLGEANLTRK